MFSRPEIFKMFLPQSSNSGKQLSLSEGFKEQVENLSLFAWEEAEMYEVDIDGNRPCLRLWPAFGR